MKKHNEKEATRTEYDGGKGSDWKEYEIKTITTAVKYKWKSAMDASESSHQKRKNKWQLRQLDDIGLL
jgi:hypothetical protein